MQHCCQVCGFRSGDETFFRNAARGRRSRVICCEACEPRPQLLPRIRGYGLGVVWLVLALGSSSAGWTTAGPYFFFGMFLLGILPAIVVHELGHAVAVRLAGAQIFAITIGSGPSLRAFRLFGLPFDLRSNLFDGGHILHYYVRTAPSRFGEAIILLGGCCANAAAALLIVAILALASEWSQAPHTLLATLLAAGAAQAICLLNLLPFSHGHGAHRSDGWQLMSLFRAGASYLQARMQWSVVYRLAAAIQARRLREALSLARSAWEEEPTAGFCFGTVIHCLTKIEGPHVALDYFRSQEVLLADVDTDNEAWAYANGNLAWSAVMAEGVGLLELADRLSLRAVVHAPDAPPLLATRGAVLILKGDAATGGPMLMKGLRGIELRDDKAEFCEFLATFEAARGDEARGAEFLRLQRHLLASP